MKISELIQRQVVIPPLGLQGDLVIPERAAAIVAFAHGSGSSRRSPRNQSVARVLQQGGLATLLFDLLTTDEERIDARTAHLWFDIALLARRLEAATAWLKRDADTRGLPLGYFGASTERQRRWLEHRNLPRTFTPWCRAAGAQIWQERGCRQ